MKAKTYKDICVKVWFNPDTNWYEVFSTDGEPLQLLKKVVVDDNYPSKKTQVTIECYCEVVNQKPKKKGFIDKLIEIIK